MDNGFSIRPSATVSRRPHTPREPLPVREAAQTELDPSKSVAAPDWERGQRQERGRDDGGRHQAPRTPDHATAEVLVDPETQDRIFRERDVRTASLEHPDQAMLRQRAYEQAPAPGPSGPRADIEA